MKNDSAMSAKEMQILNEKKIANDPNVMRRWLLGLSDQVEDQVLATTIENVAKLIDRDAKKNQNRVDKRAREKANLVSLNAVKGKTPYGKNNFGLFQLVNPRTNEVVTGHKFELTANEVIRYCTSLNSSIFRFVHIPDETYKQDAESYWRMKAQAVDEMLKLRLLDEGGSLYEFEETDLSDLDWDNPDDLRAALVHHMRKAGEINGSIRH